MSFDHDERAAQEGATRARRRSSPSARRREHHETRALRDRQRAAARCARGEARTRTCRRAREDPRANARHARCRASRSRRTRSAARAPPSMPLEYLWGLPRSMAALTACSKGEGACSSRAWTGGRCKLGELDTASARSRRRRSRRARAAARSGGRRSSERRAPSGSASRTCRASSRPLRPGHHQVDDGQVHGLSGEQRRTPSRRSARCTTSNPSIRSPMASTRTWFSSSSTTRTRANDNLEGRKRCGERVSTRRPKGPANGNPWRWSRGSNGLPLRAVPPHRAIGVPRNSEWSTISARLSVGSSAEASWAALQLAPTGSVALQPVRVRTARRALLGATCSWCHGKHDARRRRFVGEARRQATRASRSPQDDSECPDSGR